MKYDSSAVVESSSAWVSIALSGATPVSERIRGCRHGHARQQVDVRALTGAQRSRQRINERVVCVPASRRLAPGPAPGSARRSRRAPQLRAHAPRCRRRGDRWSPRFRADRAAFAPRARSVIANALSGSWSRTSVKIARSYMPAASLCKARLELVGACGNAHAVPHGYGVQVIAKRRCMIALVGVDRADVAEDRRRAEQVVQVPEIAGRVAPAPSRGP